MKRQGILECPGCGLWRQWQSWKERPLIDRNCVKCGKRIVVQLNRKPGGRPRKVQIREVPGHMPQHAIIKMTRAHNKFNRSRGRISWKLRGGTDGFVQSTLLDHDGSLDTQKQGQEMTRVVRKRMRDMSQADWDRLVEESMREVGESENGDGV